MMKLFEIRTGREGMSYERSYAWAEDMERAVVLFSHCASGRRLVKVIELFAADAAEFCTPLSTEGFEDIRSGYPLPEVKR